MRQMSRKPPLSARVFCPNAFQTVDKAKQNGYNKTIDGKGATRSNSLLPLPFFVILTKDYKDYRIRPRLPVVHAREYAKKRRTL